MELLKSTLQRRAAGFSPAVFLFPLTLAFSLLPGCVALDGYLTKSDDPPTGTVCQIASTWQKEVAFAPDTVHGGRPTPGLIGRLYLFGPEIKYPLAGDGSVTVELSTPESPSKDSPPPPDTAYKVIEVWQFDPVNLPRFLRKDTIGYGYTLYLPWGSYRPDIKDVKLRVCYKPAKGSPLFSETPLTFAATRSPH
jgi:hypothetical protein